MMEMDEDKRDGCDLEQFKAHQFLEKNDKALTWVKFGQVVKEYKLPSDAAKRVALTEFLLVHYLYLAIFDHSIKILPNFFYLSLKFCYSLS